MVHLTDNADEQKGASMPSCILNGGQILCIIIRMLLKINPILGEECWRTAFITASIARGGFHDGRLNFKNATLLALLHLAGDYRFYGEDIQAAENQTEEEKRRNYLYTYYYIRAMTPLEEDAKFALFSDAAYRPNVAEKVYQLEYASLIFAAKRLDILIKLTGGRYTDEDFRRIGLSTFNPDYIQRFKAADADHSISYSLLNGTYKAALEKDLLSLSFTAEETRLLSKLMVFIMDCKSTYTVTHTIHTAYYAVILGALMGCTEAEQNELFTGGLLHDLGKMAIPNTILESTGQLSAQEYAVMKTHVEETEWILSGIVPEKLCKLAVRHHEKLDGSGYPRGLTANDLTLQERIISCADIFSALVDERSYKVTLSKDKIVSIFSDMLAKHQLDERVTRRLFERYEQIKHRCSRYSIDMCVPIGMVEIMFLEEYSHTEEIEPAMLDLSPMSVLVGARRIERE